MEKEIVIPVAVASAYANAGLAQGLPELFGF
jgi:hypothetical protein